MSFGECSHQFKKDNSPCGATMIYLLSESHLSVHTFVDEGKVTLDLFTCDVSLDNRNIKKIICDFFYISAFNVDMFFLQGDKKP
jgi:S-adenosylmethionine/arginine decarboxylase-like enzyme